MKICECEHNFLDGIEQNLIIEKHLRMNSTQSLRWRLVA